MSYYCLLYVYAYFVVFNIHIHTIFTVSLLCICAVFLGPRSRGGRGCRGAGAVEGPGTQYRTCTFRHPKDLEVVPHPRQVPVPSSTLGTWKWSPTPRMLSLMNN